MKRYVLVLAFIIGSTFQGLAQKQEPLALIQTIEMQGARVGPCTDHLAVDLNGHRLFSQVKEEVLPPQGN